jgi:hypothetical protein
MMTVDRGDRSPKWRTLYDACLRTAEKGTNADSSFMNVRVGQSLLGGHYRE